MSSDSTRRRLRRWGALALPVALAAGLVTASPAAAAEVYPRPLDGKWTVVGHGNGHGHGMSQYGALGAAKAGKTWQEIIDFYYPGTTRGTIANTAIKVRIASLGSTIEAYPASGLSVTWNLTASSVLPTTRNGLGIARWRLVPSAKVSGTPTKFRLEYLPSGSSTWTFYATASVPRTGAFLNPTSGTVTTRRGSDQVVYRGQVRGVLVGSAGAESLVPVVSLLMESYLRTVVPGEVFASWPANTLGAQAVAARSFAGYTRKTAPLSADYDVYDDTRSQVFEPTSVNGTSNEIASTNSAITATANTVAMYQGSPAFTQFSASDGGWSSAGSKPYLVAQRDDWDAVAENPYHTWTATVSVSTLESKYPSIGTFRKLTINSRNGLGDQGGRVLTATVTGSSGSVNVTGEGLRSTMGIGRSDWFKPTFVSFPSYPRDVTGDREADVLAIESGTGALRVYPTTGSGSWKAAIRQEPGVWNGYTKVLSAGTWDEDAISDVLYQTASGDLFLRRGTGDGAFGAGVKIGAGWQVHNLVFPVGDFDGDKLTDLMARRASDGALILYSGNGYGGFKTNKAVGAGWNVFNDVLSPGDFTGDGFADVIARGADGTLYLYPGNGKGGWKPRTVVGTGWNVFTALTAVGDFTGDGKADILARRTDGSLRVYPGNGTGGFLVSKAVGAGWNIFSAILK